MIKVLKHIALIVTIVVAASCNRELDDFLGDEVVKAPAGFTIVSPLTASTATADFANNPVNFSATLSDRVSWTISLKGMTSEAEKTIYGLSTTIDSTIASFDGASENIYHFQTGETVQAILTIVGSDLSDTVTFTVSTLKNFGGILIADFDGSGFVTDTWWESFKPGELNNFSASYNSIQVPQGSNCLHLDGTDVSPDAFVGQSGHGGVYNFDSVGLPSNPDDFYFNCYLNGEVGTEMEIRIVQSVGGASEGDEYSYFIPVTWSGWKLISAKYSEFVKTAGDNSTPEQSGQYITRIKFVMRVSPSGGRGVLNIDYPIFTTGKKFEQ